MRGKQTCKILKEIRRQIAEANDIHLVIEECTYKGECEGTCPRCEAEVRYLEQELRHRQQIGKAVCVTGLAIGAMSGMAAQAQTADSIRCNMPEIEASELEKELVGKAPRVIPADNLSKEDSIVVRGNVVNEKGMPVVGAVVKDLLTDRATITDNDGSFNILVTPESKTLHFIGLGYLPADVEVEDLMLVRLIEDTNMLMGEVVVTGRVSPKERMENHREEKRQKREEKKALKND